MQYSMILATVALIAASTVQAATAAGPFNAAETIAIYKGAGFIVRNNLPLGCNTGNPDWLASHFSVEAIDLSGDGKPEAIVSEGNVACFGRDEQAFTIVARNPDGSWRKIGGGGGGTMPLTTRHDGWLDIEYGGPGMQKQPVLRWNGTTYQ
ncbi:MAG TPA: hypothetical protein PK808_07050 [Polymorphobacter sp.]|nr:hypothetical protein [Polymorphobacter sp.]